MQILLVTVGSSGDVHPFVGLGRALMARGHRVTVVTSSYFEPLVRKAGMEFVSSSPSFDFQAVLNNPRLWHRVRGFGVVMREAVLPLLRPIYDIVTERAGPGTVVVASSLALGARIAQEKHGLAMATMHLSPAMFRSDYEGPQLPGLLLPRWLPAPLKRFQFWLADRVMIDRIIGPELNTVRHDLGLPPVTRVFDGWWNSPQLVLAAFPEWFAPRQPDWPAQIVLTGFPLYDEGDLIEPGDELRAFIERGDPPIAFTPGSANVHGRAFFETAIRTCRMLGRRGLLLTRFPEQLPPLPDHMRHFDFMPFSWLLPRTAAVVHHGGVGSTAQGFAGGVPQLLMPLGFDQFDNAARVVRLGVGDYLRPAKFTAANVTRVLKRLIDSPQVAMTCRTVAERSHEQNALSTMCDAIERLANSHA